MRAPRAARRLPVIVLAVLALGSLAGCAETTKLRINVRSEVDAARRVEISSGASADERVHVGRLLKPRQAFSALVEVEVGRAVWIRSLEPQSDLASCHEDWTIRPEEYATNHELTFVLRK